MTLTQTIAQYFTNQGLPTFPSIIGNVLTYQFHRRFLDIYIHPTHAHIIHYNNDLGYHNDITIHLDDPHSLDHIIQLITKVKHNQKMEL